MNRNRAEQRKNKWKKIRQRLELLKNLNQLFDDPIGKLTNNNYVNMGGYIKTNVRKAHTNYRRPGGCGENEKWKPHDQRQLDDMMDQLNDEQTDGNL